MKTWIEGCPNPVIETACYAVEWEDGSVDLYMGRDLKCAAIVRYRLMLDEVDIPPYAPPKPEKKTLGQIFGDICKDSPGDTEEEMSWKCIAAAIAAGYVADVSEIASQQDDELQPLIDYFNGDGAEYGRIGDDHDWSTAQCAVETIKQLRAQLAAKEGDAELLEAIKDVYRLTQPAIAVSIGEIRVLLAAIIDARAGKEGTCKTN